MPSVTEGVDFDTVAREWRAKWSPENDKKALQEAQKVLDGILDEVKKLDGFKSASMIALSVPTLPYIANHCFLIAILQVQRVVCGSCNDFKVVVALTAEKYGDWEGASFAPEEAFLAKLNGIDGISQVETQTYTLMPM